MAMKLIVGLGNPEEKFQNNRHNVGHMVIDALSIKPPAKTVVRKTDIVMNKSGEYVQKLVAQYHVKPADLWVIHDDLDIPLGGYKIQLGKGPKLHKGLESIDSALGTNEYWHVRVGVENRDPAHRTPGEAYVLQDFHPDERKILAKVISEICKKLATS